MEPVLGEPVKRGSAGEKGSAGWEGRGQSKSPALLQCKLAENHRDPAGRPGDQRCMKESGSRKAEAGSSVHPDSGFRPARAQGGIAGLKNSCRVVRGNLYSVPQFPTRPWQALRRVFQLTRSHHSPMFLSSLSTELDLGGQRGSRKVELFIPDFLPSPNPYTGALGRVVVISLYAFLRCPPGHILLLWWVHSLPFFQPGIKGQAGRKTEDSGPSPGLGHVARSPLPPAAGSSSRVMSSLTDCVPGKSQVR